MTIKAITFDFWQTLYRSAEFNYPERVRQLKDQVEQSSGTTFPQVQFEAAVEVARVAWDRAWLEDYLTLTADVWLKFILGELEIELTPTRFDELHTFVENSVFRHAPTLVEDARDMLADLASRYRLGIISDTGLTPGHVLRRLLDADKVLQYFEHLTFSDELGCSKPHPNNFHSTLKALNAEPHQAVHIGDMLRTDIAGAQRVGMRGVQYVGVSTDEPTDRTLSVKPDAVISSLTDLGSILEEWQSDSL